MLLPLEPAVSDVSSRFVRDEHPGDAAICMAGGATESELDS
jgi:hypothetical protein